MKTLFTDGQVVYLCPVRYFDTPIPSIPRCVVSGDQCTDLSLYVYSETYGHNVYVPLPVFPSEEQARAYAIHKKALYDIERSVDAHYLTVYLLEMKARHNAERPT